MSGYQEESPGLVGICVIAGVVLAIFVAVVAASVLSGMKA
jgi:hypothetical protein